MYAFNKRFRLTLLAGMPVTFWVFSMLSVVMLTLVFMYTVGTFMPFVALVCGLSGLFCLFLAYFEFSKIKIHRIFTSIQFGKSDKSKKDFFL